MSGQRFAIGLMAAAQILWLPALAAEPDPAPAATSPVKPKTNSGQPSGPLKQTAQRAADATSRGVQKAADATDRGVHKAIDATDRGVQKAIDATERGLEKASTAVEKAADKTSTALSHKPKATPPPAEPTTSSPTASP